MLDMKLFKKNLIASNYFELVYGRFVESKSKVLTIVLYENGFTLGSKSRLSYSQDNFNLLIKMAKISDGFN